MPWQNVLPACLPGRSVEARAVSARTANASVVAFRRLEISPKAGRPSCSILCRTAGYNRLSNGSLSLKNSACSSRIRRIVSSSRPRGVSPLALLRRFYQQVWPWPFGTDRPVGQILRWVRQSTVSTGDRSWPNKTGSFRTSCHCRSACGSLVEISVERLEAFDISGFDCTAVSGEVLFDISSAFVVPYSQAVRTTFDSTANLANRASATFGIANALTTIGFAA